MHLNTASEDRILGAKSGVAVGGTSGTSLQTVRTLGRTIKSLVNLLLEVVSAVGETTSSASGSNAGTMWLASNGRNLGKVGSLLGGTNGEDGALPLLALPGKILELGSLGADATSQDNILEKRVVLSDSNIDLLVGNSFLGLLLLLVHLQDLLLSGGEVARVDVLSVLRVRIVLELRLGPLGLLVDVVQEGIGLDETVVDLLLQDLLQDRTDDLGEKRLDHGEKKLVVGLLELDVEVLDINIHLRDLEEVLRVLLISGLSRNLEAETISTEEDISNTLVLDARETLLPVDVIADVTKIHLDSRHGNHDLVLVLVGDLLAAPAPMVVACELKDVGCKIITLDDEVLDNGIHLGVGVLDARDRNVPHILKECGDDDL